MAGAGSQPALARAVNAMMRAMGGAAVKLRMPAATTSGTQRELGIVGSSYQEAEITPVIVRTPASKGETEQIEVLISSSALDALMPEFGATDGWSFLRMTQQIVYADRVFAVTGVSAERFAGVAYLYRVTATSNH